jgi:hypothetical protein
MGVTLEELMEKRMKGAHSSMGEFRPPKSFCKVSRLESRGVTRIDL